ncbi:trp operon repressor [Photobacterium sp. GJ3]|uniref:trp operon repressor n=1 Tax=Photobacterium sp. GJ3 TaxID=2829502 RepID=UPI001B8C5821|nr:trp operon repressor [Photobacterium sp. GJ3]QUJ68065.1 trp operon repressor [Photobacterium sp. GJ3]
MSSQSETPEFTEWQQIVTLFRQASADGKDELLLRLLLTPDERESLIARVNIFHELLNGERSQRKISELLGVGVATITRGSNELKHHDEEIRHWLSAFLQEQSKG